ncbi:hypothetical protein, partial [Wolbachia pipientis]
LSSQCLTLGSSFPYNLIENVVTTFCASLLAYKQTFLDPSSQGTEMTPSWMKTSISYFHDTILFSGSK